VQVAAAVALACDAVSIVHHWRVGHAAGSPEAVAPAAFLAAHPAFVVVAALAVVAWGLSRFAGRRRDSR
jgi:hypothetical protein